MRRLHASAPVETVVRAGNCKALEKRDNDGWTPLIEAAFHGKVQTAFELLRAGANVNARDNLGFTALDWASLHGQWNTADLLRKFGGKGGRCL